jgi:hypothetical protein
MATCSGLAGLHLLDAIKDEKQRRRCPRGSWKRSQNEKENSKGLWVVRVLQALSSESALEIAWEKRKKTKKLVGELVGKNPGKCRHRKCRKKSCHPKKRSGRRLEKSRRIEDPMGIIKKRSPE